MEWWNDHAHTFCDDLYPVYFGLGGVSSYGKPVGDPAGRLEEYGSKLAQKRIIWSPISSVKSSCTNLLQIMYAFNTGSHTLVNVG